MPQLNEFMCVSRSKKIIQPLTHNDILDLQEIFLTPGVHELHINSVEEGRFIIDKFLGSLNCYHKKACFTLSELALDCQTTDLYLELLLMSRVDGVTGSLEGFLYDHGDHDFIWIEATKKVLANSVFHEFVQHLKLFDGKMQFPVVLLSCD